MHIRDFETGEVSELNLTSKISNPQNVRLWTAMIWSARLSIFSFCNSKRKSICNNSLITATVHWQLTMWQAPGLDVYHYFIYSSLSAYYYLHWGDRETEMQRLGNSYWVVPRKYGRAGNGTQTIWLYTYERVIIFFSECFQICAF